MNGTKSGDRVAHRIAHLRQADAGMGFWRGKPHHPREDRDGKRRYDRQKNIISKFPLFH
jgi:hypothetical protein